MAARLLPSALSTHLLAHEAPRATLEHHTTLARLRPVLTQYFHSLIRGQIDDAYIAARRRVAHAHDRIGLDFHWFIGMYDTLRQGWNDAVREAGHLRTNGNSLPRRCGGCWRWIWPSSPRR